MHGSSQHFFHSFFSSDLKSLQKTGSAGHIVQENENSIELDESLANVELSNEAIPNTIEEDGHSLDLEKSNEGHEEKKVNRKKKKKKNKQVTTVRDVSEQIDDDYLLPDFNIDLLSNEVYTACKTGDLNALKCLYQLSKSNSSDTPSNILRNDVVECLQNNVGKVNLLSLRMGELEKTALHVATENGHKNLVSWLLESEEGNPCVLDANNKLPYNYCTNKPMKTLYRKFRGNNPDLYDYSRSGIPDPISDEDHKAKKAAIKAKKEAKKEKEEAKKCQELTEREKRALAAEKRILKSCEGGQSRPVFARCGQCATDISGLVPYSYYHYKFCSMDCLKQHRKANS